MTKYLDTVSIYPSILRVSGNASIESTKVVIPVELEMPEEILPYVKNIKASLLLGAEPERELSGWLGVTVEQEKHGVVVRKLDVDSPAVKSSISAGDIIDSINSVSIKTVEEFNRIMSKTTPGQTITIKSRRRNQNQEKQSIITLGERP